MYRCFYYDFNTTTWFSETKEKSILQSSSRKADGYWYVLGDLHGNAMKLLLFVIHTGVCSIEKHELERFVNFYLNYDITKQHLIENESLYALNSLQKRSNANLLLIGDVISDRGKSDFLTLYVFNKILFASVRIEVILGNHDILGILSFKILTSVSDKRLTNYANLETCSSLRNCLLSCENYHYFKSRDDSLHYHTENPPNFSFAFRKKYGLYMDSFVRTISLLKIIPIKNIEPDCCFDFFKRREQGELLFTHAPFSKNIFDNLIHIINKFCYGKLTTNLSLANIQLINNCVRNMLLSLMYEEISSDPYIRFLQTERECLLQCVIDYIPPPNEVNNISAFIWNRDLFAQGIVSKPQLINVHGHIGASNINEGMQSDFIPRYSKYALNLDTNFGRPKSETLEKDSNEKQIVGYPNFKTLNEAMWVLEFAEA